MAPPCLPWMSMTLCAAIITVHSIWGITAAGEPAQYRTGDSRPWMDPSKPVGERVDLLLPQLTLKEKIAQLGRPDAVTDGLLDSGVGLLMHTTFCCGDNATATVRRRNELQRQFLSRGVGARLGLPASWRSFINHGAAAFGVTFPEGVAQGATWDPPLIAELAAANAVAARALGLDMEWYVMNLWADPRFGRLEEGFSEEPMLTAAFVAATTMGSHGSATLAADAYIPADRVPAFWKHCCGYGAATGGLNGAPAQLTEHSAREMYIKPWRRARDTGARGVMPSHQTLLNVPCHANGWLLNGVLRSELDWPLAYVLSDTGDVDQLQSFRVATDAADAAAKALRAGVDVAQVDPCFEPLAQALQRGLVNISDIDASVRRVLNHKFSVGLFDRPYVNESLAAQVIDSPQIRALAYRVATEGAVLLLNRPSPRPHSDGMGPLRAQAATASTAATTSAAVVTGASSPGSGGGLTSSSSSDAPVLPLDPGHRLRVAVVGPNGGCVTQPVVPHRVPNVPPPMCPAALNMLGNYAETVGPPSGVQTVYDALVASGHAENVTFTPGAAIDSADDPSGAQVAAAVAAARAADVVVAVVGDSQQSCGESRDRDDLDPPGTQLALLAALAQLRMPLIVVVVGCRPMTFGAADGNALLQNVTALLVAWRPGTEGGRAIVDLLYGRAEPSGRLAQNWLRSVGQVNSGASPWFQERRPGCQASGPTDGAEGRRYASYVGAANPSTPLFHFGFGLSYAKHVLSSLAARAMPSGVGGDGNSNGGDTSCSSIRDADPVVVATITVADISGRTAPAVVQVYVQDPVAVVAHVRPWKRLVAFARVVVPAGGAVNLTLPIRADDLGFPGDDMAMRVHSGKYTLSAGFASNSDDKLTTTFVVPQACELQTHVVRP